MTKSPIPHITRKVFKCINYVTCNRNCRYAGEFSDGLEDEIGKYADEDCQIFEIDTLNGMPKLKNRIVAC